jgi:hypothetical protein
VALCDQLAAAAPGAERNGLLQAVDGRGQTCLHRAAAGGRPAVLARLAELLTEQRAAAAAAAVAAALAAAGHAVAAEASDSSDSSGSSEEEGDEDEDEVLSGLGRIAALYGRSSSSYRVCYDVRCPDL